MIESAKAADLLVAIDGCPVKCAAKTLDHAGLHPEVSLVITDMGIEKSPQLSLTEEDCRLVAEKVGEGISACMKPKLSQKELQKTEESAGA
jgi:uncharacterized metal-binding protein